MIRDVIIPYKEAFQNIVETDPFYAGLTVEGATNWTFEG